MSTVFVQEEDFYFLIGLKMEKGKGWPDFARFAVLISIEQQNKTLKSDHYRDALIYIALEEIEEFLQYKGAYFWCMESIKNWHAHEPDDGDFLSTIDLRNIRLLDGTVN